MNELLITIARDQDDVPHRRFVEPDRVPAAADGAQRAGADRARSGGRLAAVLESVLTWLAAPTR
jgi:hypothetical protein